MTTEEEKNLKERTVTHPISPPPNRRLLFVEKSAWFGPNPLEFPVEREDRPGSV